jgi:hypothetical protein
LSHADIEDTAAVLGANIFVNRADVVAPPSAFRWYNTSKLRRVCPYS